MGLPLEPRAATQLRARAVDAGVTVDAWLGIAIAYQQVRLELGDLDLSERLQWALPAQPLRFAPSERLRCWQRYLLRADGPGLGDELPEVVLGAGISASGAVRALPEALRLSGEEWQLARECELRAAVSATPLPTYIRALVAA